MHIKRVASHKVRCYRVEVCKREMIIGLKAGREWLGSSMLTGIRTVLSEVTTIAVIYKAYLFGWHRCMHNCNNSAISTIPIVIPRWAYL